MDVTRDEGEHEDRSVTSQRRSVDGRVLRIYVAEHCGSCGESRRLAKLIARRLENVVVDVIDIDKERPIDEIFAVPTFCYRDRIVSLGNPSIEQLYDRLRSIDDQIGDIPLVSPRTSHVGLAEVSVSPAGRTGAATDLLASCSAVAGIAGTVLCSLSMIASAAGIFAARGLGDMSVSHADQDPGWLTALVHFGPAIVIVSILILLISILTRGHAGLVPAIAGGVVLYAGMYLQPIMAVTYTAIAVGTGMLLLAYLRSSRRTADISSTVLR
jgi:hypothetical protein